MKNNNILVVTQWGYEEGLIQSYTLPYLKIIHSITPESKIYLVTHEKRGLIKDKEKLRKIKEELKQYYIFLLPEKYHKAGIIKYILSSFGLVRHISFIIRKRVGFIHSFCTPAGSYAYLLARFTFRKLVIDSYETHSEYMKDSGTWNERGFAYRFLKIMEKRQAKRADYLIATTPTMKAYTEERFKIQLGEVFVKPACVDLEKFSFNEETSKRIRKKLGFEDKIIGVYLGKFGDFYLNEEAFELFVSAFKKMGDQLRILLLSDLKFDVLEKCCEKHQLSVHNFKLILASYNEVPGYLSAADFAFSLYRPAPSKRFCTPIKNGEYWAMGLPVIITNDISIDSEIIERNVIGYVLKDLNEEEYNNAIDQIEKLLQEDRKKLRMKIRQIAVKSRSFSIAESIYKKIYK